MVFRKAGRCGWEGKGRFHFPLPSSVTLSGHFIPTPVTRALPGRICAQVGWGASSARPRHPWIPCRLGAGAHCASAFGECGRGSSHGAPISGWDPLLGRAIRISLCKTLIIVVSKAPPLALPGPAQEVQIICTYGILVTPGGEPGHVIPGCSVGGSHFLEPSLGPAGAGRLEGAGAESGCVFVGDVR